MPIRNSIRWSSGNGGIAFGHCRLNFGCATERVDDAGELDQQAIAGGLDDAAAMVRNFHVDDLGADPLQAAERPLLVRFDQARVARHIGRENCCEPTFDASLPCRLHGVSSVAE
jgi:hypothetical protein